MKPKNVDVRCGSCRCHCYDRKLNKVVYTERPMTRIDSYSVQGTHTQQYHCETCGGKATLQLVKQPDGRGAWQQVRLTGSDEEYRPQTVNPRSAIQVQPAYSVGPGTGRHYVELSGAQARAEVPVAYSLNPAADEEFDRNHPMHPVNMRRRIQPWTVERLLA